MRLEVALPHKIEIDVEATRVGGDGRHGTFVVLPHHIDYVILLESGILYYSTEDGIERYVAVDGGVLTKVGDTVTVSTLAAVAGDRLEDLEETVFEQFQELDQRERTSRAALGRIESQIIHDLFEFEEAP